jgi:DNA-binding transcriptional MerR regulator
MPDIPRKSAYKTSEVCRYTDTQPYVLRFWESEFPQLAPERGRGGQSVYTRADIDLILRIKELLYEEECTLDGARQRLAQDQKKKGKKGAKSGSRKPAVSSAPSPAKSRERADGPAPEKKSPAGAVPRAPLTRPRDRQPAIEFDTVPRERYEGAVDEIAHLRLTLKETESRAHKAEGQLEKARRSAEDYRGRCEKAIARLEKLLKRLQ